MKVRREEEYGELDKVQKDSFYFNFSNGYGLKISVPRSYPQRKEKTVTRRGYLHSFFGGPIEMEEGTGEYYYTQNHVEPGEQLIEIIPKAERAILNTEVSEVVKIEMFEEFLEWINNMGNYFSSEEIFMIQTELSSVYRTIERLRRSLQ